MELAAYPGDPPDLLSPYSIRNEAAAIAVLVEELEKLMIQDANQLQL